MSHHTANKLRKGGCDGANRTLAGILATARSDLHDRICDRHVHRGIHLAAGFSAAPEMAPWKEVAEDPSVADAEPRVNDKTSSPGLVHTSVLQEKIELALHHNYQYRK